ncbi:MAG: cytochrome c biogenesis protein CcsA [Actinomycetota bacterium]
MPAPRPSTSSRGSRSLGVLSLAGLAVLLGYSLVWSPPDIVQRDAVRIMYIHVPSAIVAFAACGLTTLASAMWLKRRSDGWWVLAGAAAEVGLVFTAATLITGSIWGRSTWGTYWDWDPRITSTTLLFVLLVGYLALRRIDNESGDAAQRGTRAAIVGLLLAPNVMIVHYSVDWWRSLHQPATITRLDPTIEGTMLFTLMLGIAVFALLAAWVLLHRFRVGWLEERATATGIDEAVSARRSEAGVSAAVGAGGAA